MEKNTTVPKQGLDIRKLTSPSPVIVLSEMLRQSNGNHVTRENVIETIKHVGNGWFDRQTIEAVKAANVQQLRDLVQNAQVIEAEVKKYTKDLHVMDISRKVDGCIKGGSLDKTGKVKEGSRVKDGLALVYVEKPNAAVMLMEHERGSVHDLKSILNLSANVAGPATSLFKPFLPVPFLGRNIKRQGALCQGWGCISLLDGNTETKSTTVKIAILDAHIATYIIPEKPKPKVWVTKITEQIEDIIKKSGKTDGNIVICTPHTTVGITTAPFERFEDLKNTLIALAPHELQYKHNKTAGDNNGRSHLMAEFIGNFTVHTFKNGVLDLGGNDVLSVDCDVQIPREREIIAAIF